MKTKRFRPACRLWIFGPNHAMGHDVRTIGTKTFATRERAMHEAKLHGLGCGFGFASGPATEPNGHGGTLHFQALALPA